MEVVGIGLQRVTYRGPRPGSAGRRRGRSIRGRGSRV